MNQEQLCELFRYDAGTGFIYWRQPGKKRRMGVPAGHLKDGYVRVGINYRIYAVHRIVWMMNYGTWPLGEIDHINGDKRDNRLCNLRDVTHALNMQNQRRPLRNSTTGLLGVSFNAKGKRKWRAQINKDNKKILIGSFLTAYEAHEAYLAAKRELHSTCTI